MATNDLQTNLEIINDFTERLQVAVIGAEETTAKHELWVEGTETEVVPTVNGNIKTLRGLIAEWRLWADQAVYTTIDGYDTFFHERLAEFDEIFVNYLLEIGFEPAVLYQAGILIERRPQTVAFEGVTYYWGGTLPYTTTGNFQTETGWLIAPINGGVEIPQISFATGGQIIRKTQSILGSDGEWYFWTGAFPKTVAPNSSLELSGGVGLNLFKLASGAVPLRPLMKIVATAAGYVLNAGSFEFGATITSSTQVLAEFGTGKIWRWDGEIPKVVGINSSPNSTGGLGDDLWNEITTATGTSGAGITISATPPLNVGSGHRWYCTRDGRTYIRYPDGDSVQWVEESPQGSVIDQAEVNLREALRRSYADAGFNLVNGSFETGGTLVNSNDVLWQKGTGKAYSGPAGAVAAGTNPLFGGFVDRSNELLLGIVSVSYSGIRAYSGPSGILRCYGRSNIFDNSFGEFYLDATDATSTDNDCTVLVGVGGRRWKRKYGAFDGVLVDWAGADPTGSTSSDAAFSNAINAGNGIRVNGSYTLNNPAIINASNGFFIKGSGRTKSTITKTNLSTPNLTRVYGGQQFTYNVPCIFAFVADDESYVRHVFVENLGTVGLEGDATQIHFFAPRATYCTFSGILSTHGKAIWESTLNGFINSFQNVRTALMSKHWVVHNSNAYTLTNVYSNGNTTGGESTAFEFVNTNASFISCDCDGLNIGWIADGHANLEIIGSNSEARLRIFNARGDSSINIHGGRHALSVNASQQSQEATPYRAEGNGRINVFGAKAHKFIFGATPSNKFLAIATGAAKVSMSNMQLNVDGESAAEVFLLSDVLATSSGEVVATVDGKIVVKETATAPADLLDYCTQRKIQKVIDFSGNSTQTVVSISGLGYNQLILADVDLLYRATGVNGANSVGGVATCKLVASTREQNTTVINVTNAALSPNSGAATITFTAVNSGAEVSIVATASTTVVGLCSFLIEASATLVNANRTSSKVSIT